MSKQKQSATHLNRMTKLSFALMHVLGAGMVGGLAMTGVQAQDKKVEDVGKIEITGSRVKRAEAEGALPVTVITRETLEASGQNTVAEYIRTITFNTAGSFRPQSGSSAQSFSEVSLRGLGSARTLVLVDGRRIALAPNVGSAVDMNSIPIAAVERIEILTDGASAIYGSEAIGGVINVILRKDFQGVAVSYGRTRVGGPSDGGDREEASAIMGVTGDKGRLIMGASMTQRDIIFARHAWGSAGLQGVSSFANNYYSGSPPNGATFRGPVPGGCTNPNFYLLIPGNASCSFNFYSVSADEAELGTKSFFARGEYRISNDWTALMTQSVNRVSSFGRYAPAAGSIIIEPGSMAHPWHPSYPASTGRDALRAAIGQTETVLLRHRFAASGTRDSFTETNLYDTQLWTKGRIMNVDVEAGVRKSTSKYVETGRGYPIETLARAAAAIGAYNIFNPAATPESVLQSFTATIGRDGTFDLTEQFANATFDVFKLSGGTSRMYVTAERRKEVYADIYDSLSEAGIVIGSAGNSAGGGRKVNAFGAELVMPFTRELEGTLAVRRENYSDYGSDTSPKVSIRYQPMRTLLLRASAGEGFAAPTLPQLTQKPAFSAETVRDARNCLAAGLPAATCAGGGPGIQVSSTVISNPALTSEKAKQWSFGAAWDVTPMVSLKADVWNTKIDGVIVNVSAQTIVNRENGTSSLPIPPGLSLTRAANGAIANITLGSTNEGTLEQRGVDAVITVTPSLGKYGRLRSELTWSRVLRALSNGNDFNGTYEFPRDRASLTNRWTMGSFDASWNVNMIGVHGDDEFDFKHPRYITQDVQFGYVTPLKGVKLIIGAVNVTGKMPKLDGGLSGRPYPYDIYDGYGRQTYAKVEVKF